MEKIVQQVAECIKHEFNVVIFGHESVCRNIKDVQELCSVLELNEQELKPLRLGKFVITSQS